MTTEQGYVTAERPGVSAGAPTFFLFHGTGGDEHQFLDLATELRPDTRRIGVRGDVSEGGALRYFRRHAEGRYDMTDLARATARVASFVAATAPAGERLALGYSNGANIIASVLFTAPESFDAAVLMHPLIPFDPPAQPDLGGRRILITAGRNDPIAPADGARRLADYFAANGADVGLVWHDGGHEIRRNELLAVREFLL